ncbi:glycosyltransferase [Hymenobacter rigui]|uniref:Glycosyltransferase n=1 Tax=Hymenobacter rigui TaxID=334424 RepID=A0A428K9H6_9BACT|nr:glycosyltransferase [Hymenobacter rigui]RSK43124.1 glycosyltransferase [Hymenobacter rigui]
MHQQDIVMVCQQSWSLPLGTNARSLAREFARTNRVLYVQMPLDLHALATRFRRPDVQHHLRVLRGQTESLTQVEPNVWVLMPDCLALSVNKLPAGRLFWWANRLNATWLAGRIQQALHQLQFARPVLLQDGIIYQGTELKRLLQPRCFVYYVRDYMLEVPYFRRHGAWVEQQLLRQADVVATNSGYLADYARRENPNSVDIGQGCVLDLYQAAVQHPEPADLAAIPHPRIGYTGFLTTVRLDLSLLLRLAHQRPDWQLVLVGPEDEDFRRSELHYLTNVHFLGNKLPAELPAYVQHLDACINPQLNNATTAGNYPLKIDEYLAMGKPIVATHTRTMELFAAHVYLARHAGQWPELLEKALASPLPQRTAAGIAFARSHTWAASAARLYDAVTDWLTARPTIPGITALQLASPHFT